MTNDLPYGCRACGYYADCKDAVEPICGPVVVDEDADEDLTPLDRAIAQQGRDAVEKTSGLS